MTDILDCLGDARVSSQVMVMMGVEDVQSRMGFPTQLKSKKVKISKEKTSQMIIKGKLSQRGLS